MHRDIALYKFSTDIDIIDNGVDILDGKGSHSSQASNYGGDRTTNDISSSSSTSTSRNCHYNEPPAKSTSQSVQVRN